ncbi:MAG: aminoacyl-tRNA hydrolase [Gemmatimonadales bacterium]|nr:aminoacyl-tRNA hydrolase [Gemmatimonadota bacterium]MBP6668915.1 aminoacyl-tRNA hydrolase [Gemmatimonadales bacterium]MBP9201446.1 aminoacyl-tRNA hydrolase [Gemmatimonadales bacterium]
MQDDATLRVSPTVRIPLAELSFRATRSGGPGGQHVNTSSTRVELWWHLDGSPSLTAAERARVHARLRTRITDDGWLRVVSAETRSQAQNRQAAVERFRETLEAALHVPKTRKATRPSKASKERRLVAKRRQSARKRDRRLTDRDD